jgi:hypothetical protein
VHLRFAWRRKSSTQVKTRRLQEGAGVDGRRVARSIWRETAVRQRWGGEKRALRGESEGEGGGGAAMWVMSRGTFWLGISK